MHLMFHTNRAGERNLLAISLIAFSETKRKVQWHRAINKIPLQSQYTDGANSTRHLVIVIGKYVGKRPLSFVRRHFA